VLILNDVEPAAVLAAYLDFRSDQGKSTALVQLNGRLVVAHNAGDQRVEAGLTGESDEVE
jgi:PHD/YefM family antitoxin component YafN of YafNO toxin-antitoxin module